MLTHDERTVSAERNTLHERIAEVRRELEDRGVPGAPDVTDRRAAAQTC